MDLEDLKKEIQGHLMKNAPVTTNLDPQRVKAFQSGFKGAPTQDGSQPQPQPLNEDQENFLKHLRKQFS